MKQKQKKEILLKELFKKGISNTSYSVLQIFKDCGVNINDIEAREIAKSLDSMGQVEYTGTIGMGYIRLKSEGAEYVEEYLLSNDDNSYGVEEKEVLKSKLDEFAQRLTNLELGQEIIYEDVIKEIDELKDLLNTLNKKNWKEVFKGKLVDLGFGSIMDECVQVLKDVFKGDNLLLGN